MEVKLEAYEGPLDLLLRLIERSEIDIYDIPIATLTDQYLAVVRGLSGAPGPAAPMEGISEFLVMAATLLEIKSRSLLPKPPAPGPEDEGDPREELVRKLLEYKQCQAMAAQLRTFTQPGERVIREGDRAFLEKFAVHDPAALMEGVSLQTLWAAFSEAVKRRERRTDPIRAPYGAMPRERFTVTEKIAVIERLLARSPAFSLAGLFEACHTREEMVVTFLALLELTRQGRLRLRQTRAFTEVYCEAGG